MLDIVKQCKQCGVAVGVFTDTIENARKWINHGVKYIALKPKHSMKAGSAVFEKTPTTASFLSFSLNLLIISFINQIISNPHIAYKLNRSPHPPV